MTIQRNDEFKFKGQIYSLIVTPDELTINLSQYGFTPKWATTDCFKGYYFRYAVNNSHI